MILRFSLNRPIRQRLHPVDHPQEVDSTDGTVPLDEKKVQNRKEQSVV